MLFQETPLIFFSITSCRKESYHYLRVQQNVKYLQTPYPPDLFLFYDFLTVRYVDYS